LSWQPNGNKKSDSLRHLNNEKNEYSPRHIAHTNLFRKLLAGASGNNPPSKYPIGFEDVCAAESGGASLFVGYAIGCKDHIIEPVTNRRL
jgi:hypothetical protein